MTKKRAHENELRRCKYCGRPEKRWGLDWTDIAPSLGACIDCLNLAMKAMKVKPIA